MANKKSIRAYFVALAIFTFFCILKFYDGIMIPQNTTVFAFNYDYGFVTRGLIGSLYEGLDGILPMDLFTYNWVKNFSLLATLVLYLMTALFMFSTIKRTEDKNQKRQLYLGTLLVVVLFPSVICESNLGRLDTFLFIISFVSALLIIKDKALWLVPVLSVIGVLIHQGFVFTNVNVILALFLFIAFTNESKKKKYIIYFAITFVLVSVLFLYFEFFSNYAAGAADIIIPLAKSISYDGKSYGDSIINHEVLSLDVYEDESWLRDINIKETPMFLFFFIPYIGVFVKFVKGLFAGEKKSFKENLPYLVFLLGALTIVPEVLLKVDYGRYVLSVMVYYLMMVMAALSLKDERVDGAVDKTVAAMKKVFDFGPVWVGYAMVFMPLMDVHISPVFKKLFEMFF